MTVAASVTNAGCLLDRVVAGEASEPRYKELPNPAPTACCVLALDEMVGKTELVLFVRCI